MSQVTAYKHKVGKSVTPANNFIIDASADNGTMKIERENGQQILNVSASNIVTGGSNATLVGNGPVVAVIGNVAQAVSSNVVTKVTNLTIETFDTHNAWSSNKFTAPIAGYYNVNYQVFGNGSTNLGLCLASLAINGVVPIAGSTDTYYGSFSYSPANNYASAASTGSNLVYLDVAGTIELYARLIGTGTLTIEKARIDICLVRAA